MVEKKTLGREFDRFEVYLNVLNQQVSQQVSIPFKINFGESIQLFAQFKDPIYFSPNFGIKNLVDESLLSERFLGSPFCFYETFSAMRTPFYFTSQTFLFKFFSLKEQFLTLEVKFQDINLRNVTNLLTWTYFTPKNVEMLKFRQNQLQIQLPLSYFFLNLGELFKGLCMVLVEKLDTQDTFKFI